MVSIILPVPGDAWVVPRAGHDPEHVGDAPAQDLLAPGVACAQACQTQYTAATVRAAAL